MGHRKVVKVLLAKNANVHGQASATRSPIHVAAEKDFTDIAKLLLDYQADPYRKDRSGKAPIYYATYYGNHLVMNLLISYGEDVNQKIPEGSLLHIAVEKGHTAVVDLLIHKGAQLDIKNSKGEKPLDIAINHGYQRVANRITQEAIKRKKMQE